MIPIAMLWWVLCVRNTHLAMHRSWCGVLQWIADRILRLGASQYLAHVTHLGGFNEGAWKRVKIYFLFLLLTNPNDVDLPQRFLWPTMRLLYFSVDLLYLTAAVGACAGDGDSTEPSVGVVGESASTTVVCWRRWMKLGVKSVESVELSISCWLS